MRFINFRIITNGEKFRIEGSYYATSNNGKELKWITLADTYYGTEYGYIPMGEKIEFDTKDAAIKYIKEEYGNTGYQNMLNTWSVC